MGCYTSSFLHIPSAVENVGRWASRRSLAMMDSAGSDISAILTNLRLSVAASIRLLNWCAPLHSPCDKISQTYPENLSFEEKTCRKGEGCLRCSSALVSSTTNGSGDCNSSYLDKCPYLLHTIFEVLMTIGDRSICIPLQIFPYGATRSAP